MAITLYYTPMGSATRVHWALEELGVPFQKVRLQLDKGDQKKPEYLAINPNGKVPALVDGDLKLFESLAILLHLGDRYGVAKGLWPASGTDARSEAYMLSVWSIVDVQNNAFAYIRHAGAHPRISYPRDKQVKDAADQANADWRSAVRILGDRLAGRAYLLGDAFTLVDVTVASVIGIGPMLANLPVEEKSVADWLVRCQSRPALAKAISS